MKAEPIPAPLLEFLSSEKYRLTVTRDSRFCFGLVLVLEDSDIYSLFISFNSEQAIKELRKTLEDECIRLKLSEKWVERMKNIWFVPVIQTKEKKRRFRV